MTRVLPTSVSTGVEQDKVSVAFLLEMALDSGSVYLWSGQGDLDWNGQTWLGVGGMGAISAVTEDSQMSDARIKATLSHVPVENLPDFVQEFSDNDPVGRSFTLSLAFFDEDTSISDVVTLTAGFVDAVSMNDGAGGADGSSGGIELMLASEAALLSRKRGYRLTDQHQEALFSGDRGLEFVTDTNLAEIRWGSADPQTIGRGASYSSGQLESRDHF